MRNLAVDEMQSQSEWHHKTKSLLRQRSMRLNVLQSILDHVVLRNQVLQFSSVGVLLDALSDDTEAVQMDLLVLRVFKVVSACTPHNVDRRHFQHTEKNSAQTSRHIVHNTILIHTGCGEKCHPKILFAVFSAVAWISK